MKAFKRLAREAMTKKLGGYIPIFLDYPVDSRPRYGYGEPPHPELARLIRKSRGAYRERLAGFLKYKPELERIDVAESKNSDDPCWNNAWFAPYDTVALYSLLVEFRPATYLEVGSGYSTRVARRALEDHALATRVISIDPEPRSAINRLCHEVIRKPIENVVEQVVTMLKPGDIFFVDSSHRCLMNSDVTAIFLEVLPRLAAGTIVHFHDIHLPYDYPPQYRNRYYSEQYLLALYLLWNEGRYEIVMPNTFVSQDGELKKVLDGLWEPEEMRILSESGRARGSSFWLKIVNGPRSG